MSSKQPRHVAVIGSGLGGLSAAIGLAQEGFRVSMFEKNAQIGGKLNVLSEQGYTFDLGPSILTLPQVFERLFERAGKRMADYVSLRPLRPHWRNFFEDGRVVDLYPEPERMAEEARKAGEDPARVVAFLNYAAEMYDRVDRGYFQKGLDTVGDFSRFYGLGAFPGFDLLHSMHGAVARRLHSPYLRDIFDFFIKYVGSSAYRAPAFMNCLPTIQFRHDLWYVDGGLYNLARALGRLMEELGVELHLNAEVTAIRKARGRVQGLTLADGTMPDADVVVCNMETLPAYRRLLHEDERFLRKLGRLFEPACSGLVIDLGLDIQYPQLAHHNFFFSGHQKQHFHTVFQKHQLPQDPTIYVVAASRTDPTVAPRGCDCLKILPHIPYLNEKQPLRREDYLPLKERVLDKLERMGLKDLRRHTVFEHFWTPLDIEKHYYSNGGSIYGVVSDRFRNLAFKTSKQSGRYENLFFVGGSVNPGGGMPMVVICGQHVARMIAEQDRAP